MHLAIGIPSRNRPEALIESIASVIRVSRRLSLNFPLTILVRQNSDENLSFQYISDCLRDQLGLTPWSIELRIQSNDVPVFMHENCELLVQDAFSTSASHLIVLPDRRLLTNSLSLLLETYQATHHDITVFDNQTFWLSSKQLQKTRELGYLQPHLLDSCLLTSDIYHCRFDGLTPRLYNCLVSLEYLSNTKAYFGSYIGGPCPDISFQFRVAFLPRTSVLVTSIPVIATNARHAHRTVSNTGIPNVASSDKKNITEQRGIFGLHKTIVYVGCLSHIADYVGAECAHLYADPSSLLASLLWEMSCPQTPELFCARLQSILAALSDSSNIFFSRLSSAERAYWLEKFQVLSNTPAESQKQPLQDQTAPLTIDSFELLAPIEP